MLSRWAPEIATPPAESEREIALTAWNELSHATPSDLADAILGFRYQNKRQQ